MPFLTQGKTNWRFLVIVVVLVVVVGGGILNYCWRSEKQEPETFGLIDINQYLAEDVILYGVDMPPEAEYGAISTNEAILIIARSLEEQGVEDIKIGHLLWSVAPRGEFFIVGNCNFIQGDKPYNKFLAIIEDGSEGDVGEPLFIFKDTDVLYGDSDSSYGSIKEAVGRYESRANSYGVTPILRSSEIKDASDWQAYRNEEYGFEVNYPEDWNIRESDEEVGIYIYKARVEPCVGYDCPRNTVSFEIKRGDVQIRNNVKAGIFDYDATMNKWFSASYMDPEVKQPECPPIIDINQNIKGYYGPANLMAQDCDFLTYIITNKDYSIEIKQSCGGEGITMKKIISTLRLLNDVKSIEAQCE